MKILGRWKRPRYLISFVLILLRFSLIFKGFQRLVSWLLHHFRIWLYWLGKPHAHRVLSDQVIHLRSPQHRSHALCLATRCADIRCFHSVENHDAGHSPNIGKAHSADDETDKL